VSLKTDGKLKGPEACEISITVKVESCFPKPIVCSNASMSIIISDGKTARSEVANATGGAKSGITLEKSQSVNPTTILIDDFDVRTNGLRFGQVIETKVDSRKPQAGKILCHDAHHVLR